MKSEDTASSSAPSQPSTPAPPATQPTYTAQWPSTPMAIDPALQQSTTQHATTSQYYSPYASHYPQAAYATHYQAYAPPVAAQQSTTQVKQPVTAGQTQYQTSTYSLGTTGTTGAAASATNANAMDTSDIATLNDALGSAGVDLRAEEETLQRSQDTHQAYRGYANEDRTRKQAPKPAFDTRFLGATMRTIGTNHKVNRIPEESVTYLALSLRARLQDLVTAMIAAAHHRTDTTFERPAALYEENGSPMWSIVVRSDVAKQLAALEKVEREEETRIRKERKERADMQAAHAAALAAQANGSATPSGSAGASVADGGDEQEGGQAKKKRKKEGPGVTARNMSEDVRKKMSNAVATQAAGLGGKYAWMNAANAATPTPKAKAAAPTPAAGTGGPGGGGPSTWARPYVPTVKKDSSSSVKDEPAEQDDRTTLTMRDAMFVIEKERGHGGGRGAARGWV